MACSGLGMGCGPDPLRAPGPRPTEGNARLLVMRWGYAGGLALRGEVALSDPAWA